MNSYCYYKIVIAHLTFHDIWSPPNGNNGLLCRELRRIWLTKLSAKLSWAEACELKVSKFQKQIFLFSFEPKKVFFWMDQVEKNNASIVLNTP